MFLIAVGATVLAFVQNSLMFGFGMKEMAIFSFPLSFTWIFLAEIGSIWSGYFCARRFFGNRRHLALSFWAIAVLGVAELTLPVSYFTTWVQHARRENILNQIELVGVSIEPLSSDKGGRRFALTYTLRFPRTAHYLTFPAYLGQENNRVFGNYFTKVQPEFYDEEYVFDASRSYRFTVVFDTEGKQFDFTKEEANIDICDSKDYFMTCRIIGIGLAGVPAALAAEAPSGLFEPAVAADNVRAMTEKSIRLDGLRLTSPAAKAGAPVEFSFVITNIGKKDIAIPDNNFASIISINYGWEAVSESAKTTKVIPGIMRFGNVVAAGGAQFTSRYSDALSPGGNAPFQDKIMPFEPFAPGEYKLHVFLFSRYSTDMNKPVQELVQDFSVGP